MNTHRGRIGKIAASLGLAMSLLLLATCESSLLTEIRAAGAPQSYSYTVTFDSQDADVPADPETMTVRSPAKNLGSLPTDPEKADLTFGGWWTDPEGHGSRFFGSTTVDADITVYAFWYDDSDVYEVSFDTQGGTGGTTKVDAILGQPMPFAEAPGPPPDKPWLEFGGYYTGARGQGDQYYDSNMQSVQPWDRTVNTTLVAEWIYQVGSPGPAGGIVFYDKGNYSDEWRYLEAAPASTQWSGTEKKPWGGLGYLVGGTGWEVGAGAANTAAIVAEYGNREPYESRTDYAAKLANDLVHDGFYDWFLPSSHELYLMCENLYLNGIGGFESGHYWSSHESGSDWARGIHFSTSHGGCATVTIQKPIERAVRAARAF